MASCTAAYILLLGLATLLTGSPDIDSETQSHCARRRAKARALDCRVMAMSINSTRALYVKNTLPTRAATPRSFEIQAQPATVVARASDGRPGKDALKGDQV